MNTAAKGNAFELVVRANGVQKGALVSSRRHIGGAGDELWVWPDGRIWLIEVKATKGPWDKFGPKDRLALSKLALRYGAQAFLAFRLENDQIRWYPENTWPSSDLA